MPYVWLQPRGWLHSLPQRKNKNKKTIQLQLLSLQDGWFLEAILLLIGSIPFLFYTKVPTLYSSIATFVGMSETEPADNIKSATKIAWIK